MDHEQTSKEERPAASIPAPAEAGKRRFSSRELFEHANEIEIDHEGRIYRLRVTQLNKLILTA
jgi:hemin uptake protein HemP